MDELKKYVYKQLNIWGLDTNLIYPEFYKTVVELLNLHISSLGLLDIVKRTKSIELYPAVVYSFLAVAEHHMPKRYKILFSEQAPTQYFISFCRMAELLHIAARVVLQWEECHKIANNLMQCLGQEESLEDILFSETK